MRHGMTGVLAVFVLALPAAAQDRRCTDDNGRDRCTMAAVAQQNAAYGVPAIHAPALRATPMVRAFFVDGYGGDIGMVAFTRPPGSDPTVEWRAPRSSPTGTPPASMVAPVPLATWNMILAEGRDFDRSYAPRTPAPRADAPPPPLLCLHSWVVRVEAIDADGAVRRHTENMCGEDALAGRYAFRLAASAVATLPYCALLDPSRTRNDVTRLSTCSQLAGDRAAGAQALDRYRSNGFANPDGPDAARSLAHLFHERSEVTWPGKGTVAGPEAASRLWAASASGASLWVQRVFGETADRVRIEGTMTDRRAVDPAAAPLPFTMIWTRDPGIDFRLRRFTTG